MTSSTKVNSSLALIKKQGLTGTALSIQIDLYLLKETFNTNKQKHNYPPLTFAGLVCAGTALTEPNGICSAGYFCRGGAYTDKPSDGGTTGDPCPKGHYCPPGTGTKCFRP